MKTSISLSSPLLSKSSDETPSGVRLIDMRPLMSLSQRNTGVRTMFTPAESVVIFAFAIFLICVLVTVEASPVVLHVEGFK